MKNMTKAFILMLVLTLVVGVGMVARAEAVDTLALTNGYGSNFSVSLLTADGKPWPENHVFTKNDLLLFKFKFDAQETPNLYYGTVTTDEDGNLVASGNGVKIHHSISAAYYSNLAEAEGKVLYTVTKDADGKDVVTVYNEIAKADTSTVFTIPYTSNADLVLNGVPTTEDDPNSLATDQNGKGVFTWWYDKEAKQIKLKFTEYAFTNNIQSMYLDIGGTVDYDALENDNQFTFEIAGDKEILDLAIGYTLSKSAVMVINTETNQYEAQYTIKMTLDRDHCLPAEKDGTLSIKDVAGDIIGAPTDISIAHASETTGVEIAYDASSKSFDITSSSGYVPKGEYTITYTSPVSWTKDEIENGKDGLDFNNYQTGDARKNKAEIIKNEEPTNVQAEAQIYYSPMRDYVKLDKDRAGTGIYNGIYAETDDAGNTSYYVDYYVDVKIQTVETISKITVVDPATDYLEHTAEPPKVKWVKDSWWYVDPGSLGAANATVTRDAETGEFVLAANPGEKLKPGAYRLTYRMKLTDKAIEDAASSEAPLQITNKITELYVDEVPVPNPYDDLEETTTVPSSYAEKTAQLVTSAGKTLIKWTVKFNRGFYVGKDAEVFDTLTNGKVYVDDKNNIKFIVINDGKEIISEGNIENKNPEGLVFSDDLTEFSYTLGSRGEATDKEYTIIYYTEVETDAEGNFVPTANEVGVDYTGDDQPDDSVTVSYPTADPEKPDVKKTGEYTVDSATKTMTVTWMVEVDLAKIPYDLLKKLVITDTLPAGMTLVSGSTGVKLYTGSRTEDLNYYGGTYDVQTVENGTITVTLNLESLRWWNDYSFLKPFPDCKKVTLTFVAQGPLNESGKTTYENTAVVDYAYGPFENPDPVTATGKVEYNSAVAQKLADNPGNHKYNAVTGVYGDGQNDGKLDYLYQITLVDASLKNRDTATEIIFTDYLPSIKYEEQDLLVLDYVSGSMYYSDKVWWEQWSTDKDVALSPSVSGNAMSVTFNLPANWPSDTVYFYYVCNVSDTFLDTVMTTKNVASFGNGKDYPALTNTVKINIDGQDVGATSSFEKDITDNALSKTASLLNQNGQSARGISYTIEINKDARTLNNGQPLLLEDALSFEQGSATVMYDQSSFVLKSGTEVLDASEYTLQFNVDGTSFQITVPDSTALTLTYTAKPVVAIGSSTGKVSNQAKLAGRVRNHEQNSFVVATAGQGAESAATRTLQINKRETVDGSDEFLGAPIEGAGFKIYSVAADGLETFVTELSTDKDGKASFVFQDDIFSQVFVVRETTTPEGYQQLPEGKNEWYFYFPKQDEQTNAVGPTAAQTAIIEALEENNKKVEHWNAQATYIYNIGNTKLPAGPVEVELNLTKTLETEPTDAGVNETFKFTMEFVAAKAADGTPKTTGYEIVAGTDRDGKVTVQTTHKGAGEENTSFGDIKFTEEGEYTFKVLEISDDSKVGYVAYDDTVYTVTYTVKKDEDQLTADRVITDNKEGADPTDLTFKNKYMSVSIGGFKYWNDTADTSHRLTIDKGTFSTKYLKLYTLQADGSLAEFADLNINGADQTKAASLEVYIEGDNGNFSWYYNNLPGFDADDNELKYVVKEATVNGYQTFYVNPVKDYSYKPEDDTALYPRPNNTGFKIYNTLAKDSITITKKVEIKGEAPVGDNTFEFTIMPDADTLAAGGYTIVDKDANPNDGKYSVTLKKDDVEATVAVDFLFDNFHYDSEVPTTGTATETDADGNEVKYEYKTFTFTVAEAPAAADSSYSSWKHDKAVKKITFTVKRYQDSQTVEVTFTVKNYQDSQTVEVVYAGDDKLEFTNTYEPFEESVYFWVWKKLDGQSSAVPFDFELVQKNADGSETIVDTQTNETQGDDPDAAIPQGGARFEVKYGESDLGETYEYIIREVAKSGYSHDTTEYKYQVEVSTDGVTLYSRDKETGIYSKGNQDARFNNKTLTSVKARKFWDVGENNVTPPADISEYLTLYSVTTDADGEKSYTEIDHPNPDKVEKVADDEYIYTWSNLQKYTDNDPTKEIVYEIKEENVPGYYMRSSMYTAGFDGKYDQEISNNYIEARAHISIMKFLDNQGATREFTFVLQEVDAQGNPIEGKNPDKASNSFDPWDPNHEAGFAYLTVDYKGIELDKPVYYTLTEQMPEEATAENNYTVGGIQYDPTEYKLKVEFKYTNEVDQFNNVVNGDVTAVVYLYQKVAEDENGATWNYVKHNDFLEFNNFTTQDIDVTKKWEGKTPANRDISDNLTLYIRTVDDNGELKDAVVNKKPVWNQETDTYTWSNLRVCDDEGNKIAYIVKETPMEGYQVTYQAVEAGEDEGQSIKKDFAFSGESITNTEHKVDIPISIRKVLHQNVTTADGEPVNETYTFSIVPDPSNPKTGCTITDPVEIKVSGSANPILVDKQINFTFQNEGDFEAGKTYTYKFTISEVLPDKVPDGVVYDTSEKQISFEVQMDANGVLTVKELGKDTSTTETLLIFRNSKEVANLSYTKVWNDTGDTSRRPKQIPLNVYVRTCEQYDAATNSMIAAGEWRLYDTVTVDVPQNKDSWAIEIPGLPGAINNLFVEYGVVEGTVDGYIPSYTDQDDNAVEVSEKSPLLWTLEKTGTITNTLLSSEIKILKSVNMWGISERAGQDYREEFSFTVTPGGDYTGKCAFVGELGDVAKAFTVTVPVTGTLTEDWNVLETSVTLPIEFYNTDKAEYIFTVQEVIPEDEDKIPGMSYDDAEFVIKFTVGEDENGLPFVDVSLSKNGEEKGADNVTDFWNSVAYRDVSITKYWEVKEPVDKDISKNLVLYQRVDGKETALSAKPHYDATTDKYTWYELPYYTNEDEEITYFVREEIVLPGYTAGHARVDRETGKGYSLAEESISNTYKATGALELKGTKTLTGRDLTESDVFTFVVMDGDDVVSTGESKAKGEIVFDPIVYTYDEAKDERGIHTYTVKETSADGNGITVDKKEYTVKVKVEDDGKGNLNVTKLEGSDDYTALNFTNTYKATGVLELKGTKTLTGRDPTENDVFTFVVMDGDKVVSTGESNDKGEIVFKSIEYTYDKDKDERGIHTYTVKETSADGNGITVDKKEYTVKVKVEDDGKGNLNVTKLDGSDDYTALNFTNTYKATGELELKGTKTLTGRDLTENDVFTFAVMEGNEVVSTGESNDKGEIVFESIEYIYDEYQDDRDTYTYTVNETSADGNGITVDTKEYTVKVKVEDDGKGNLKVTKLEGSDDYTALNFTNTYKATGELELKGTKKLIGRDLKVGEFSFTLYDSDGKEIETVTNGEKGSIAFKALTYTEADAGKTYTYQVKEVKGELAGVTYVENPITVQVTITDNGDGTLTVTADKTAQEITFTNTYAADGEIVLSGIKTLLGGRKLAAGDFTFVLSDEQGNVIETVTNNADGSIVFKPIAYTQDDVSKSPIKYTVKEVDAKKAGYTYDSTEYFVSVEVKIGADGELEVIPSANYNALNFSNTYEAAGTLELKGTKKLTGRDLTENDEFTFAVMEGNEVVSTGESNAKGEIVFEPIEYTQKDIGQKFTYQVSETNDGQTGITYDTTVYTVKVEIVDNGNGTLTAKAEGTMPTIEFNNTYKAPTPTPTATPTPTPVVTPTATPAPTAAPEVSVTLKGSKALTGRQFQAGDMFFFDLIEDGRLIQQSMIQPANGQTAEFVFDAITYKATGKYSYIVRESTKYPLKGITYDAAQYAVEVNVTADADGKLTAETTIKLDGETATTIAFSNAYHAKGALTITAKKTVDGAEPDAEQVYDFVLLGDGVELDAKNDKGSIVFDELTYDETDVGKTYTYTIKETTESTELLVADASEYELKVTVADNGDGTLKLQKAISKAGEKQESILFNNQILAHLTISKKVEGVKTEDAFDMIVRLYDADGAELTAAYEYTGDVKGTITSGGTIALKDGQSVTIKGLPDGTKYTVEEEGSKAYTTTVNGKAGTKAEGLAIGSDSRVDFVNTLETTTFTVTKVWEGGDLGAIVLRIYANGELMEPQPEVNRADNTYTVTGLQKYDENGELIVYSAKEKGVSGYLTIYQNVGAYAEENKALYDGGKVINRREKQVSFKIQKVWTGLEDGEETPDITLTLYCNGEVMNVATPKPDSKGWYKYYDLPVAINGVPVVYKVVEETVDGFTTTYEDANGAAADFGVNGGKIINTKVPQTGDDASLSLWLAMMGASAAMLTMLLRRRKAH